MQHRLSLEKSNFFIILVTILRVEYSTLYCNCIWTKCSLRSQVQTLHQRQTREFSMGPKHSEVLSSYKIRVGFGTQPSFQSAPAHHSKNHRIMLLKCCTSFDLNLSDLDLAYYSSSFHAEYQKSLHTWLVWKHEIQYLLEICIYITFSQILAIII